MDSFEQSVLSALAELVRNGGAIVSDAECSEIEIATAKARGHHFVDKQGYGFVVRSAEWLASREVAYFQTTTEVQARKYKIRKCGGGEIDPAAKYFVVRYDAKAEHGHVGRIALVHYCTAISEECPQLAAELFAELEQETDLAVESLKREGDDD